MPGKFHPARRVSLRRFASALAMGAALAGAGAIGTAATTSAAFAQNSPAFAKVYQPVATIANAQGGDLAAAKAQIPAVLAAASTAPG